MTMLTEAVAALLRQRRIFSPCHTLTLGARTVLVPKRLELRLEMLENSGNSSNENPHELGLMGISTSKR
jgi:hypothetical protein